MFILIFLQINVDDSLPKYICNECLESLRIAMRFKKNCEVSDKKFRKILNPMGNFTFILLPNLLN